MCICFNSLPYNNFVYFFVLAIFIIISNFEEIATTVVSIVGGAFSEAVPEVEKKVQRKI